MFYLAQQLQIVVNCPNTYRTCRAVRVSAKLQRPVEDQRTTSQYDSQRALETKT